MGRIPIPPHRKLPLLLGLAALLGAGIRPAAAASVTLPPASARMPALGGFS